MFRFPLRVTRAHASYLVTDFEALRTAARKELGLSNGFLMSCDPSDLTDLFQARGWSVVRA